MAGSVRAHPPPHQLGGPAAAKIVYPELTMREALYLGGIGDEELDAVRDQKFTWRTGYVYHKDLIMRKLRRLEACPDKRSAGNQGGRLEVERMVDILRGTDEDRFEKVFGEYAYYLSEFLDAAEERRRNGVAPETVSSGPKKRRAERAYSASDEEEHATKRPYLYD